MAAIQRGEQLAKAPKPHRMPDHVPAERPSARLSNDEQLSAPQIQPEPKVEVRVPVVEVMQADVIHAEVVHTSAALAPTLVRKPSAASRDWGSLLNGRHQTSTGEPKNQKSKFAPAASNASEQRLAELGLPVGLQDGFVLSRLVESRQPVSGLVVSIGAGASQDANRPLPADVRALIQSLLGPNDFAAQSGADEFLLIYPGERGASAQRRLGQIAEQLWDFQLRSMGSLSILFSWGGVEVRSESIDEAIASATERMQETRRGRRVLTMERAETPLRRAV